MQQDQMTLKGTVDTVLDTETFPSGFTKRVLVVNTGGEWPERIPVEFLKDKTAMLDNLQAGQIVHVGINPKGRYHEGTDKFYPSFGGWKIDVQHQEQPPAPRTNTQLQDVRQPQGAGNGPNNETEDIPFSCFDRNGIY
jgi:single-strand DNA-binding protein